MAPLVGCMQRCCEDIRTWMRGNFLKLNDSKAEVLLVGSRQQLKISLFGAMDGDSHIAPATSVRDLGAVFGSNMTMVPQVNTVCQSAVYHIKNIGKIRRFLDRDSCKQIVHAFVTSRLYLNNALLTGIAEDAVTKLQKVQNIGGRVVTRVGVRDHITPVLKDLHWLPVHSRIQYKVLLLVYKTRHGLAPNYISELLELYRPSRALRSATDSHLLLNPWLAPLEETGL